MLSHKAVIVVPEISATTLKKTDKEAGLELTEMKRATSKSARVVKELINPSHLKKIIAVQSAFRAYLMKYTVPWFGNTAILPKTLVFEFSNQVQEFKMDLHREVESFLNRYSVLIDEARSDLGDLFDSHSYPSADELRDKFAISVQILPVPESNQFSSLGLDSSVTDSLKAEALAAENRLLKEATENLYKRIQKRVQMLSYRFKDKDTKKYHESLIEGLELLTQTLPDLNIGGDPNLQLILDEITTLLNSFNFEDAKKSEEIRDEVATKCDAILERMNSIF